jgi:hypothetical protein
MNLTITYHIYVQDPDQELRKMTLILSVFSALAKYRVVKIVHSRFEVVLRTMKHTMIYPCSGPSSKVIALHSAV